MTKHWKNLLLLSIFLLLAAGCSRSVPVNSSAPQASAKNHYDTPLKIASTEISVEIADTDDSREQGLSNRNRLTDNQGMLFDFSDIGPSKPGFWMKDMKFDLDFIWIQNEKVVGITPNVPAPKDAESKLPIYYPPSTITQVLEVNAGWSAAHSIKTGDAVKR